MRGGSASAAAYRQGAKPQHNRSKPIEYADNWTRPEITRQSVTEDMIINNTRTFVTKIMISDSTASEQRP